MLCFILNPASLIDVEILYPLPMRTQILMFTLSILRVEVSPDYICTVFYPSLGDITGRQRPLPLMQGFAPSPTLHSSVRQLATRQ